MLGRMRPTSRSCSRHLVPRQQSWGEVLLPRQHGRCVYAYLVMVLALQSEAPRLASAVWCWGHLSLRDYWKPYSTAMPTYNSCHRGLFKPPQPHNLTNFMNSQCYLRTLGVFVVSSCAFCLSLSIFCLISMFCLFCQASGAGSVECNLHGGDPCSSTNNQVCWWLVHM